MDRLPLSHYRIIDFGWALAGAIPGMLLSDLGAQVLKVESRSRLDGLRMGRPNPTVPDPEERMLGFHAVNRGKGSISINLKSPEAPSLLKRLVKVSDAILENFTPGTLEELGLGYSELVKEKGDLIMVSYSGAGQYGPLRDVLAYAPIMSSLAGFESLSGYPDQAHPSLGMQSYADYNAGIHTAVALLAALRYRDRTGRGQHVDISEMEATTGLIGEAIMDYTINGRVPRPQGNRRRGMAPHGIYPCQGNDRWIAIAVATQEEWLRLCRAMGNPPWCQSEEFAELPARLRNQDKLDQLLAAWTRGHEDQPLAESLQAAGVAATSVLDPTEQYAHPHFRARGLYVEVEHPRVGRETLYTNPLLLSEVPRQAPSPAPLLGQSNHLVFTELLGMPEQQVQQLAEAQALY